MGFSWAGCEVSAWGDGPHDSAVAQRLGDNVWYEIGVEDVIAGP